MIAALTAATLLFAAPPAKAAEVHEPSDLDPIAIVGATVWTMDEAPIENATVLFRQGKIIAVGTDVEIPGRSRRIDGSGLVVTPGLVDPSTTLGLVEIGMIATTRDDAVSDPGAIHAAYRVTDGLNPASTPLDVARMEGITSGLARPRGGIVSGQSAWIRLRGDSVPEMVIEAPAAMHAGIGEGALGAGGNARGGVLRRLREAFADARLLLRNRSADQQRRLRDLSASRLDLLALEPVLERRIPLVVTVNRASDIEAALAFAKEERIRLVLEGAAEGWRVADRIAAAKVPVILDPMTNLPGSFETLGARYDNAALLEKAGVTVALSTGGAHDVRKQRQGAGLAVANGMSREGALAAVTRVPLEIFGIARERGTLAKGKVADLVVWDGDPFELSTNPVHVFIDGREMPLRSRQTELLERYRTLPPSR